MKKITEQEVRRLTNGKMLCCPFCGEIPVAQPWHGGGPRKTCIGCDNDQCDARPEVCDETPEMALRQWNHRYAASEAKQGSAPQQELAEHIVDDIMCRNDGIQRQAISLMLVSDGGPYYGGASWSREALINCIKKHLDKAATASAAQQGQAIQVTTVPLKPAHITVDGLPLCYDCGATPGTPHANGCYVERCSVCGGQRIQCRCKGHDRAFARWTGIWPGAAEATELGIDLNTLALSGIYRVFFVKPTTKKGGAS